MGNITSEQFNELMQIVGERQQAVAEIKHGELKKSKQNKLENMIKDKDEEIIQLMKEIENTENKEVETIASSFEYKPKKF